MNVDFLTALKEYLNDQHNSKNNMVSTDMCLRCFVGNHLHTPDCPVGKLQKQIDIALVKAVRAELEGGKCD
jgi:hypothetical protein